MSMMAIPSSRCSWRMSSRIWVCVVTSRAVVGSSAMSRVGWQDSAMAIMARWRRPPLSWFESWSTRCSGEDTPTRRSISMVLRARLAPVHVLMEHDRLGDLVAHRVHGTERGHRLLEDEGDLRPADGADLGAIRGELGQIHHRAALRHLGGGLSTEADLAVDDPARTIHDPEDRAGGDALAAAAFPHDAEGGPWIEVEAHAVDRLHGAFVLHEVGLQIPDRQERRRDLSGHRGPRHPGGRRRGS